MPARSADESAQEFVYFQERCLFYRFYLVIESAIADFILVYSNGLGLATSA